jgi:O-acetylserine/cysteine efflux transporter
MRSLIALAAAGILWGTTVPLTKVVLPWLGPAWLTVIRFALAALLLAAILLAGPARRELRRAVSPGVILSGAAGYGLIVMLQNVGVKHTSVSHAALIAGAIPVLVALLTTVFGRARVGAGAWAGFVVAFVGVGAIALDGSGHASVLGDGLVLLSVLASAGFVVAQPRLLAGRDPVAVTTVQFAAAAVAALPFAAAFEAVPTMPTGPGVALAALGLVVGGTLAPFTLFAYGQARVSAETAGGFLNLEPLIGVVAGVVAFGDPVGGAQVVGGLAILGGLALTATPLLTRRPTVPIPMRA